MTSNATTDELARLDATAQADLVRTGQINAAKLVEAAISRTERLNSQLNSVISPLFEQGRDLRAADYLMAAGALNWTCCAVAPFFEEYDLFLTPTIAKPPPPFGTFSFDPDDPDALTQRVYDFAPFTSLFNVTGQPGISLPLYWNADGLPIGVQFVASFPGEATLFRIASQLEEARPWSGRASPYLLGSRLSPQARPSRIL